MLLALTTAALLGQFPIDTNVAAFETLESSKGLTLSGRAVPASPYREYRVETRTPHTVNDLCVAIFEWATGGVDLPGVVASKVLTSGENDRVIYAQLSFPIVSKRDYTLSVKREWLGQGRCRIRFRATTDGAPPTPNGFVRMEKLWGEWDLVTEPAGGTHLTHTLFSDPAGSVPSFLVHGDQKASTRDSVTRALEKTRVYVEKKSLQR
ncbi:MAG: START domain-containing protein [Myxococcales bacterium]|nr:START domain-containing protein [Myxococcales bacterium]